MSRVLKIVGYAVMLFLVYIGSTSLLKSCKGAETGETVVEEDEYGEYSSDEEIYDEFFESEVEEGLAEEQLSQVETKEEVSDEYDEDFSFEASETEKKKINTPPKRKTPAQQVDNTPAKRSVSKPAYTGSTGGDFLVVAGSYLIQDNAHKMVQKLQGLGFNGAEVVNFDGSQYHSISAGRYSSYDEAGNIAKSLKNKGIDCYVHTRK